MGEIQSYTNLSAPDGLEEAVISDVTNSNATKNIQSQTYIEDRNLSKSVAGAADVALTNAESLYSNITLTGAITANINVTIPDGREKFYHVYNNTSGSFTITFKTLTGLGIVVPQGIKEFAVSDGTNVELIDTGDVPVGTILPFNPGYYTDGINGGYTFKLGAANTVAAVNTWLSSNKPRYKVCDGSNVGIINGSPIFDNAGAYLPDLTDDRFLMGGTTAGGIGGSSTMAHTHDLANHTHTTGDHALTKAEIEHRHLLSVSGTVGTGAENWRLTSDSTAPVTDPSTASAHNHGATGLPSNNTSDAASNAENRPQYLSCFYIMRIK